MIHVFMQSHEHFENLAVCKEKQGNEHALQCTMRFTSYLDGKMAPLRHQENTFWLDLRTMSSLKTLGFGLEQQDYQ
jgi:hypothetical protein